LVPDSEFVRYIENEVAKKFGFGRWLEVVAAPRTGKSAGGVRGVMRWIVENDVENYAVLVVAPNRRLAENLYRYAVGAAARLYRELRKSGVKVNRGEFFSKVRARLYLGGEQSCMLNRSVHFVEDCVKNCPLFQKFSDKWRRVPPAPTLDPWILKLSGYCPFIAASSKAFWYKSIAILTSDALWFAMNNIIRHNIRNVIIVFDEYLIHLARKAKVKRVDLKKVEKVFGDLVGREFDVKILERGEDGVWTWVTTRMTIRDAVTMWNDALELVEKAAVEAYSDFVGGDRGMYLANAIANGILRRIIDIKDRDVDGYTVYDLIVYLFNAAVAVLEISKHVDDVSKRMKLRRLGLWMQSNSISLISAVGMIDMNGGVFMVDRVVSVRWTFEGDEEYIVGHVGGFVRGVIAYLLLHGRNVGIITTSVDDSDVPGYRIYPHDLLEHVRINLSGIRKPVKANTVYWSPAMFYVRVPDRASYVEQYRARSMIASSASDLNGVVWGVTNIDGNVVMVGNKSIIVYVAELYKRMGYKVEYHGDLERGVVDYIIVEKPDGGKIMLVSPHSRVSMGVDPPLENPRVIVILYGIRRPAREYVKMYAGSLSGLVVQKLDLVLDYRKYSDGETYYVYVGSDAKYDYLLVYDIFDFKIDSHMLLQVIGRWYMQDIEFVVFNRKYNIADIKYYYIDFGFFDVPRGKFYIEKGYEKIGSLWKPIFEGVKSFDEAVERVVGATWRYGVDAEKVLRSEYYRLRSVYNSLRYIRVQLRYRRLDDRDLWLLTRKLASMINGFEYAERNCLDVPDGLKRFYYVFRDEGVGEMLERVKSWLNIADDDWSYVVRRLILHYGVRSLFLEFKYGLRKIPKGVIIRGINDWRDRANLTKYATKTG